MDYQLDTAAAKKADQINSRIDEKGLYHGQITRAEAVTSQKGTQGIDISFKADSGANADYLTIWTHDKEGKQLPGFNLLMAIMTCLKVKNLTASQGEVEKYDRDQNARVKSIVPLYRDLMNKPIGLLIYMEEYQKKDGGFAWKPVIAAPCSHDGFTATEILNQSKSAEALPKMIAALRDKEAKRVGSAPASNAPSSFSDLGDDIPW